jgi:hypothetical protein
MARVARIIPWSVTLNPIPSSPTQAFDPTTPAVRVQQFTLDVVFTSVFLSLPQNQKSSTLPCHRPQATGSPFPSMEFFPIPLWCHQRSSLGALNCPHCQVAGPCSSASINWQLLDPMPGALGSIFKKLHAGIAAGPLVCGHHKHPVTHFWR